LPPPHYLAPKIKDNPKFFPYFKDCIGALDGTHIPGHAQLRNKVERIFGVVKRRFPILERKYENRDMTIQRHLVYTLTGLHNFIRQEAICLDIFNIEGSELGEKAARENSRLLNRSKVTSSLQRTKMEIKRDRIADVMWIDYLQYITL